MRLLDVTEVKLERLDLTSLTPHNWKPYVIIPEHIGVTTVLRHIALNLGTLKLHEEDIEDPEVRPWRMLMGMGWEAMSAQLYDLVWQPKLLRLRGVVGHPDAYRFITGTYGDRVLREALAVGEWKYTAKSLREKGAPKDKLKDLRSEWFWQNQVMSYLAMARETLPYFQINPDAPLLAEFHVLWAMGCYEKYTLDERYMRYLIEYEREEVDRCFAMVEKNVEAARGR